MGVALFAMVTIVSLFVQSLAFHHGLTVLVPELADIPFNLQWFEDPAVQAQLATHQFNGDITASTSLWNGTICLALILLTAGLWKRRQLPDFLGLRMPKVMDLLKWLGVFALVLLGVEGLAHAFPVFHTDFMEKVLATTTSMPMLILSVVIVGPLFEEFLLRGLLFGSLRHIVDDHSAIALTAGVFAFMHLQYPLPIMLLIIPMSIVLGYARARSGSIWVPVVLHMVNNGLSVMWP